MEFVSSLEALNTSAIFTGLMMITMNLTSRFLPLNLSPMQEKIVNHPIIQKIVVFIIAFVATRNIWYALIVGSIFILLTQYLLNENSFYCIIPRKWRTELMNIQTRQPLLIGGTSGTATSFSAQPNMTPTHVQNSEQATGEKSELSEQSLTSSAWFGVRY